ncbi:DUF2493 domain-containing protein [Streptosporangium sp. NPDC051023]|uniref:DUF2493 domain-containing protein n=1 Tax=Streptosporangium sp. NPDC051023 TaxID=3155410 RepID=UPI003450D1DC
MIYRILVTGSRRFTDAAVLEAALLDTWHDVVALGGTIVIVHGHARGADRLADAWACRNGVEVERYPADWATGRGAGPRRNAAMVALGADLVIAAPQGRSLGTRDCMRRAAQAGIEIVEVTP